MESSDIMENEIISLFLNRKKQNVSRYSEILAKYSLKGNVKLNKIINKIVEIYYDKYYLDKNLDFSLLTKYFEITKTKESIMKDVLLSSILFYKNSGLEEQIDNDIKNIVVLSNLIYLAINLDEFTNEFKNESEELESRISSYFNRFENKIKVEENLDELKEELTNLVKKDVNSEKKFWKLLGNNTFILKFRQSLKNNNIYQVNYEYNIKMLNRYDESEIDKTILTRGINDDILTIYIELLSLTILKNLLYKHNDDLFFINIDYTYFDKNKNLISLDKILSNPIIKKHIVFCFSAKDLKECTACLKYLHDKDFKVGLIDANSKLSTSTLEKFNYIFMDSELYEIYKEFEDIWKTRNIEFIIDNDEFKDIDLEKMIVSNR